MTDPAPIEPDNILEFKPRPAGEMPIEIRHSTYEDHKHGSFLIDERERTVLCRKCNKYIDPITALLGIGEFMADVKYKLARVNEFEKKQHEIFVKKEKAREERRKGGSML